MGSSAKMYSGGVVNSVSNYRKRLFKSRYGDQKPPDTDQAAVEKMLWEYKDPKTTAKRKKELKHDILMRLFFLFPHYLKKNYHLTAELFNDAILNMTVNTLQAIDLFKPELGFPFTNYLIGYFRDAATKTLRSCNVVTTATLRQAAIDAALPMEEVENAQNPYIVSGADDDLDENGNKIVDDGIDENGNRVSYAERVRSIYETDEESATTLDEPIHKHQMVIQGAARARGNAVELDDNRVYAMAPGMEQEIDVDERIQSAQLINWLESAMSEAAGVLTPDERLVLTHHYGLFGAPQMKYEEIAQIRRASGRGCACSRISQINTAAIKKIRDYFNEKKVYCN